MYKITIAIRGIHGPDMFDEVSRAAGHLYMKGTNPELYVDVPSDRSGQVLAALNSTPGIHAELFGHPFLV